MSKKKKRETIKLKGSFIEMVLFNQNTKHIWPSIMDLDLPFITKYFLAEAEDQMQKRSEVHFKQKQKLVKEFALKREEDKEDEKQEDGTIIKGWKKDDLISDLTTGSVDFGDNIEEAIEELNKLDSEGLIDLKMAPISIDWERCEEKGISPNRNQMMILKQLFRAPKEQEVEEEDNDKD